MSNELISDTTDWHPLDSRVFLLAEPASAASLRRQGCRSGARMPAEQLFIMRRKPL